MKRFMAGALSLPERMLCLCIAMGAVFAVSIRSAHPLALVEPVRAVPLGAVEFTMTERAVRIENVNVVGNYRMEAAFTERFFISGSFDFIHDSPDSKSFQGAGDSRYLLSYYLGEFFQSFGASVFAGGVFPTGPNPSAGSSLANLSMGVHELRFGGALRADRGSESLHFTAFYGFRQGVEAVFYDRGFFTRERYHNDYISAAFGGNSSRIRPFVFSAEAGFSRRVYKKIDQKESYPVAGGSVNPLDLCAGVWWYFTPESALSFHFTGSLFGGPDYPGERAAVSAWLRF